MNKKIGKYTICINKVKDISIRKLVTNPNDTIIYSLYDKIDKGVLDVDKLITGFIKGTISKNDYRISELYLNTDNKINNVKDGKLFGYYFLKKDINPSCFRHDIEQLNLLINDDLYTFEIYDDKNNVVVLSNKILSKKDTELNAENMANYYLMKDKLANKESKEPSQKDANTPKSESQSSLDEEKEEFVSLFDRIMEVATSIEKQEGTSNDDNSLTHLIAMTKAIIDQKEKQNRNEEERKQQCKDNAKKQEQKRLNDFDAFKKDFFSGLIDFD